MARRSNPAAVSAGARTAGARDTDGAEPLDSTILSTQTACRSRRAGGLDCEFIANPTQSAIERLAASSDRRAGIQTNAGLLDRSRDHLGHCLFGFCCPSTSCEGSDEVALHWATVREPQTTTSVDIWSSDDFVLTLEPSASESETLDLNLVESLPSDEPAFGFSESEPPDC